ncbi:hypothetical protein GCM10027299_43850 [Larkinella ripae]
MKVLFIQLSDIHFRENNNPVLTKSEKLFEAIANNTLGVDKVFLILTGDIAFSGTEGEYKIAYNFFYDLVLKLEIYSTLPVDTIMIPGNHDCDFRNKNNSREALIKSIQTNGVDIVDNSIIDILTAPQKDFFYFQNRLSVKDNCTLESKIVNIYKFKLNDKEICINCINSAYISQLNELPGQMFMPIDFMAQDIVNKSSDLIITLFHHPIHWLNPDNRREFKAFIERNSDVYLTGHEHQSSMSLISDLENNNTLYIEGDVFQESNDPNKSGFNLIFFDLDTNEYSINKYQWEENIYNNTSLGKGNILKEVCLKLLTHFF